MNKVITAEQPLTVTPLVMGADSLLSQAVAAGASIDTLERLMALRKEMRAEHAKEAFNAAMAAFQSECPVIKKTKAVKLKSGGVAYKYAPIENIISQVKDLIQKHGFRYLVTMEFNGGLVKAICHVVHTLGHEEASPFEIPLGTKTDIMSQTQVVAAASTFAKRYAFLNAFGIMTGDEDNDAVDMEEQKGNDKFKKSLLDKIKACKTIEQMNAVAKEIQVAMAKLSGGEREEVISAGAAKRKDLMPFIDARDPTPFESYELKIEEFEDEEQLTAYWVKNRVSIFKEVTKEEAKKLSAQVDERTKFLLKQ